VIAMSSVRLIGTVGLLGDFGPQARGSFYLQRCGSSTRLPVSDEVALSSASSRMIVWSPKNGQLDGRFLPDEQRFIDRLPPYIPSNPGDFAVSDRHLYAMTLSGRLWDAPLPQERHRR
jgi:hypothetical protein